jgi:hypothetical protein
MYISWGVQVCTLLLSVFMERYAWLVCSFFPLGRLDLKARPLAIPPDKGFMDGVPGAGWDGV